MREVAQILAFITSLVLIVNGIWTNDSNQVQHGGILLGMSIIWMEIK